jgi:hypothetical protein
VEHELDVQSLLLLGVVDLGLVALSSCSPHALDVLVEHAAPQVLLRHLLPGLLLHLVAGRDDQLCRGHHNVGMLHGARFGVRGGGGGDQVEQRLACVEEDGDDIFVDHVVEVGVHAHRPEGLG